MTQSVAVVGATGFVGSNVVQALLRRDLLVRRITAPRVHTVMSPHEGQSHVDRLARDLDGCSAVVNAAGIARAASAATELDDANHAMPVILAKATRHLGLRLVHISSAAVQGRRPTLDASPQWEPFSPYSVSKANGERALLETPANVCIYRPPGVHGRERSVTRSLVRLATSRLSTVASPGTSNTPQALVENVADAAAFLATTEDEPPTIVHHPSEGLSTAMLMSTLGGRPARLVPKLLARTTVGALYLGAKSRPGLEGQARRVEVLWFGQNQARSWLEDAGWQPYAGLDAWDSLGSTIREDLRNETVQNPRGSIE